MRNKKKKNYAGIVVSLFIAFIMVTSIMGYIFGDSQERVIKYNGIKFTAASDGWKARIDGKAYSFSYDPKSLEDIKIPENLSFDNVFEIDTTYDTNASYRENIAQSLFELSNILSGGNIYLRAGFTTNSSYNVPIITCDDATLLVPVIYYKNSNQTLISSEGNCIVLEAYDGNSFLALTDRIAYKIMGIME